MADQDLQQINSEQAAMIRDLQARLESLESRVPAPEPEPLAPGVRLEFPRVVYRLKDDLESDDAKKQIDVPGNDLLVVNSGDELQAAIKEGWNLQPQSAPTKKGRK